MFRSSNLMWFCSILWFRRVELARLLRHLFWARFGSIPFCFHNQHNWTSKIVFQSSNVKWFCLFSTYFNLKKTSNSLCLTQLGLVINMFRFGSGGRFKNFRIGSASYRGSSTLKDFDFMFITMSAYHYNTCGIVVHVTVPILTALLPHVDAVNC